MFSFDIFSFENSERLIFTKHATFRYPVCAHDTWLIRHIRLATQPSAFVYPSEIFTGLEFECLGSKSRARIAFFDEFIPNASKIADCSGNRKKKLYVARLFTIAVQNILFCA